MLYCNKMMDDAHLDQLNEIARDCKVSIRVVIAAIKAKGLWYKFLENDYEVKKPL